MSAPNGLPTSASFVPRERSRASEEDVAEDRFRKWHDECVLEVDPADIEDDDLRKAAMTIGNDLYGRRGYSGSGRGAE
ncbi:hypothetical protein QMT40_001802 [Parvibaculaceae bacterium PLY_AMNH_Bact1]|nr:hypothetical protein QMT40_001802 [Parvibaculaceae bacterium PLY_AMNH_Bact1]